MSSARGQQYPGLDDRASLGDLFGIRVEIATLPPILLTQGVSAERLTTDLEAQLSRSGVKISSMGETHTGDPHLEVTVHVSDVQSRVVGSLVELNFVQICFMRRNPLITFNRTRTWHANATVSLGPVAQLGDRVRREVTRLAEQFIEDYRHGNP